MTALQIWNAIDKGLTVYWGSEGYAVEVVPCKESNKYGTPTYRNGEALRSYFISNYFGCLMSESELSKCFVKEEL